MLHDRGALALILLAGVLWRAGYIAGGKVLPDGDEALFGLMAREILAGNFYIYFIGQHYLGACEAYLIALLAPLTGGVSALTLKIAGIIIWLGYALSLYWLIRTIFGERRAAGAGTLARAHEPRGGDAADAMDGVDTAGGVDIAGGADGRSIARFAVLLSACAPACFTYWSLSIHGVLWISMIGQALLALAWKARLAAVDGRPETQLRQNRLLILLALLSGFAWYCYALVAPYLLAILLLLAWPVKPSGAAKAGLPLLVRIFHAPGTYRLQTLLELALLPLGGLLLLRTFTTALLLPYRYYLPLLAGWLIFCAIQLARFVHNGGFHSAKPPRFSALAPWLTLGMLPVLIHLILQPEVWYRGGFSVNYRYTSNAALILFDHLPNLLGPLEFSIYGYRLSTALALALLFLALALAAALLDALRGRAPGLALILAVGCCTVLLFAGSTQNYSDSRHLLPLYTSIFVIHGYTLAQLERHWRGAGLIIAALLIGAALYFSVIAPGRPYLWPQYVPPEFHQLKRNLEELGLRKLYCRDFNRAYTLQLDLGPQFAVGTSLNWDNYPRRLERMLQESDVALLAHQNRMGFRAAENEFLRELKFESREYRDTRKGGSMLLFYDIRDATGRPLTLDQVLMRREFAGLK